MSQVSVTDLAHCLHGNQVSKLTWRMVTGHSLPLRGIVYFQKNGLQSLLVCAMICKSIFSLMLISFIFFHRLQKIHALIPILSVK